MATNKAKINSVKSKESVDKPQFIDYTESEAYKIGRERESKRTPQEQEALEKEVNDLMNKDYSDEP